VTDERLRLQHARELVLDVLSGAISEESHPDLFDDDVVLFSVRLVEKRDPAWLRAQLANGAYPRAARIQVLGDTAELNRQAPEILGDSTQSKDSGALRMRGGSRPE
jgi:hypothetical protein